MHSISDSRLPPAALLPFTYSLILSISDSRLPPAAHLPLRIADQFVQRQNLRRPHIHHRASGHLLLHQPRALGLRHLRLRDEILARQRSNLRWQQFDDQKVKTAARIWILCFFFFVMVYCSVNCLLRGSRKPTSLELTFLFCFFSFSLLIHICHFVITS